MSVGVGAFDDPRTTGGRPYRFGGFPKLISVGEGVATLQKARKSLIIFPKKLLTKSSLRVKIYGL